jgi:hypothetical protein
VGKAAACCFVGVGAVWRCYDQLQGMDGMYAMVMCVLFGFSMVGIAVSIMNAEGREQREAQ